MRIPLLKTADQYLAWRARIYDKCWAVTGHDLSQVTDEECLAGLKNASEEKDASKRDLWVSRCWMIITGSLSDELLLKMTAQRGCIRSLLNDINISLMINQAEEVTPLRLELYGATMAKEGQNDLQTYIAYLVLRRNKLEAHGKKVDDAELVAIFLRGLHPLYQPLQLHFAIPGQMPNTFDKAVNIVRRYSATPAVASELVKLKTPAISQHMFAITTDASPAEKSRCWQFANKGTCKFGANCKFSHPAIPEPEHSTSSERPKIRCAFCFNNGHTAKDCRKRLEQLAEIAQPPATISPSPASAAALMVQPDQKHDFEFERPFTFVFAKTPAKRKNDWVLDSGATQSITFDEKDCKDIRDCHIEFTAAGGVLSVRKIGTAVISAVDDKGRERQITVSNCLIQPDFPCKLLSLPMFTKKGHTVIMEKDACRISNSVNDAVLLGFKEPSSQLYFLQSPQSEPSSSSEALRKPLAQKSTSVKNRARKAFSSQRIAKRREMKPAHRQTRYGTFDLSEPAQNAVSRSLTLLCVDNFLGKDFGCGKARKPPRLKAKL